MTKELLIKFFQNRYTEQELGEVISWANTKALTQESFDLILENLDSFSETNIQPEEEKLSLIFDRIQQKIQVSKDARTPTKSLTAALKWITKAAAVFLIPTLIFLFHLLSERKQEMIQYNKTAENFLEVIAPIGSRTVVYLSDGSEVHLNYGSKLKYPQIFSGESREVKLSGEGFFKVAPNAEKPFIVHTGLLNIVAMGTSFNVSSYPDEKYIETTLVNGKVLLEKQEPTGKRIKLGMMVPDQHIKFNKETSRVSVGHGNIEKYIAWKDGKLVFEDASIFFVAEKLSRMFNVNIEVADNLQDYLYTVTFIDEPLVQILDLMTIATPVEYTIYPRKKNTNDTYSKQTIVINKRK